MNEKYKGSEQTMTREFTIEELIPYGEKIVEALLAAPAHEEWKAQEDARDDMEGAYIKGETGRESLDKKDLHENAVIFPDFETMIAVFSTNDVLSKLLPEEQIRHMIEHERSHLEDAKRQGYDTEIGLTITCTAEGGYVFTPFVTVSVDFKGVDESEVRKHLQNIASAPGEDVSDSDRKKF